MKKKLLFQLLPILAALGCYVNSLSVPFIWDDEAMIKNNELIRSWQNIPQIFLSSSFGGLWRGSEFYRPIQFLTYLIDYQLWGNTPLGFHFTNILLFLISVFLLQKILTKMLVEAPDWVPILAATIYAVHPMNIEVVTYLSGRGDLLGVLFSFASIYLYLCSRSASAFIFFALALFSKENMIVLPFFMLGHQLLLLSKEKRSFIPIIPFFVLMLAYGLFRLYHVYYGSPYVLISPIAFSSLTDRLLTVPEIIVTYLRLFFLPYDLHMEYLFVTRSWLSWSFIGCSLLLLLFAGILLKYKKAFNLLWFLVALAPVLHIVAPLGATLREHWLVLPALGLLLLPVYQKKLMPVLIVFICFLSYQTITRNFDWQVPLEFYRHDVQHEPLSFLLHNNVGVEEMRRGNLAEAKKYFQLAIEVSPGRRYGMAYSNLGVVLQLEGNFSEAEKYYRQALYLNPDADSYKKLINVLIKTNQLAEIRKTVQESLIRYPFDSVFLKLQEDLKKIP
ncbi:MAG: tetratricopeptide repeat protein [Deltaproteobacteria bacterium]|nr:tetratricopeptide repeat protein [Deltaproteobacteria bacterium]